MVGRFLLTFFLLIFFNHTVAIANSTEEKPKFAHLKWMTIDDHLKEFWHISEHHENAQWMFIEPVNPSNNKPFNIIVSVSKKSGSYVLALSKLLEVFNNQKINAHLSVININVKSEHLDIAMEYAKSTNADLIFSMGSQSEALLHNHYRFGDIPIVTSTNKDPVLLGQIESYDKMRDSNMAYTSLNVPLPIQMQYLAELKPNLKTIGLMYNKNHKQVMGTEVTPTKAALKEQGINVIDIAVSDRKTAIETLEKRMPEAIEEMKIIDPDLDNTIFWVTSSTAIFANMKTVNAFSENIPVVAGIPNAVAEGDNSAVLAFGIDRRSNAHMATLYAIDILQGKYKPGDLPVGIVTPPDISINFLVAQKIGLKVPFSFLENANFIYDYSGKVVRDFGKNVVAQ